MGHNKKIIAVYEIRNLVTNKFYIGSSANLHERFRTHRNKLRSNAHPNPHLQASWNKHGEDVFKFTKLAEFESIEDMFVCEAALIDDNIDKPECFNMARWVDTPMRGLTGPAHPNYGKPMAEEQKAQLREATTRQWAESDPRTGRKHTAEARQKISAKVQVALAEGRGGKFIPSEETRKKMSEALQGNQSAKGYKRTGAEKDAIAERMRGNQNWLGKTHSEESKAKMGRAIIATAPDGTQTTYPTITALRTALSLTPPTVHRVLESGKPLSKGRMAGWGFAYA
jgi:group I intron endonuclease